MARVVKTFLRSKIKKGESGHPHREHRSKKGRTNKPIFERADQKERKFKEEKDKFGNVRHIKKRGKLLKFKL